MANVLGTLFADIAAAIRDKSGQSGTMKPLDFPTHIANIPTLTTGGGSGSAAPGGSPSGYDYDLAIGESFSIQYDGSSPSVTCPPCLTYLDDGGTLLFTAAEAGTGTLTVRHSDTVLGTFSVRVNASQTGVGVTTGSFKPTTGSPYTVTHGLGTVPDVLIVYARALPEANTVDMVIGYSAAMQAAAGENAKGIIRAAVAFGSSTSAATVTVDEHFEHAATAQDSKGALRAVTAETFTLGGSEYGLFTNKTYTWIAIYGLT